MKDEAEVLNEFEESGGHVHFQIKRLYTVKGKEFMGSFCQYCDEECIRLTVFRQNTGTKWRLGKMERFNRTSWRLMEKEMKLGGKRTKKYQSCCFGSIQPVSEQPLNHPVF